MPSTIRDLLNGGRTFLKSAGIEDADISAGLILQHLMDMNYSQLQLNLNKAVGDEIAADFNGLIKKRSHHHPLQYLIGEVEFYNVKIKVDPRALIPRPETEILVEQVIALLESHPSPEILDIGTGSGNIAIALAVNIRDARITAIDISSEALVLAEENASLNQVCGRIDFVQANCLTDDFWQTGKKFDTVVSNPPYVDAADFKNLQPEIRNHEPKEALIANGNSLAFFEFIAGKASAVLKSDGLLCFEVGAYQAPEVAGIIKKYLADADLKICKDLNGIDRVVSAIL